MKIRNGFVSNSSSSSFVCITPVGKVKEMLKNEDEITQKVVNVYLDKDGASTITLDGNKYQLWNFTLSTEEFGCDCDLEDDDIETAYDKWHDFIDKLRKQNNCIVKEGY